MNIKTQPRIFKGVKKKKLFALGFFLVFFSVLLVGLEVQAAECSWDQLCYRPNIPIPIKSADGVIDFAQDNPVTDGTFLAKYIVAIYTYGAGFAGIIAMFMLVIAGWRWLLAAGNASKITEAKQIVNGVLLGLALLFGGQLLLRQISENFNSIQSLDVELSQDLIDSMQDANFGQCANMLAEHEKDDVKDLKCEDYNEQMLCEADLCKVDDGLSRIEKRADDRCVPRIVDNVFVECIQCPNTCPCTWYSSAFLANIDPCDCDNEEYEAGGPNREIGLPDIDGKCLELN